MRAAEWKCTCERFPEAVGACRSPLDGGRDAIWSRDGKEIYFRDGDKMMVAAVAGETVEPSIDAVREATGRV